MKIINLRLVYRNFKKHLSISIINLLGLAIGITTFMLIVLYSRYEYSYDKYHKEYSNIYRVCFRSYLKEKLSMETTINAGALPDGLKREFPEVVEATRVYIENDIMVQYNDRSFFENKMFWVDSTFLSIFTFPLIDGKDTKSLLTRPNTMLISESAKRKYFGDENPIGKILVVGGWRAYQVEGVFKDVPENSHLKFDFLLSYRTLYLSGYWWAENNWLMNASLVYIKLLPGTDIKEFESKLPSMWKKYMGEFMDKHQLRIESFLQPLERIHLHSHIFQEVENNGDGGNVLFLIFIGCFVIIISWLNYAILSTTMAMERAKEIGIKKVIGAFRLGIIKESMFETAIHCGIAIIISVILIIIVQPSFHQFNGQSSSFAFLGEFWFWLFLWGIFILSFVSAGLYSALILSSYNPLEVLKGKMRSSKKGVFVRKMLLIIQFSISIALIVGTFVVFMQLKYLREKEIGIDIQNKLILKAPRRTDRNSYVSNYRSFQNEILGNKTFTSCASSVDIPGIDPSEGRNWALLGKPPSELIQAKENTVDYNFVSTYKVQIIAGRNFDREISTNDVIMINERFSKMLGFKNPKDAINAFLYRPDRPEEVMRVIAVYKDFNHVSPKIKMQPMYFRLAEDWSRYYTIQYNGVCDRSSISYIETIWKRIFPGNAFDYFILEDFYNKQFDEDQKFGNLFMIFTFLAIFITCLGLYSFSSYSTLLKQKEIGIRKVLGANIFLIWKTFIKEYIILIGISATISLPIIYYFINRWLNGFADRITLGLDYFYIAPIIVIIVSLATVSHHIIKISLINPTKSLKYE
jgi:putative ABC transport system permease protein